MSLQVCYRCPSFCPSIDRLRHGIAIAVSEWIGTGTGKDL